MRDTERERKSHLYGQLSFACSLFRSILGHLHLAPLTGSPKVFFFHSSSSSSSPPHFISFVSCICPSSANLLLSPLHFPALLSSVSKSPPVPCAALISASSTSSLPSPSPFPQSVRSLTPAPHLLLCPPPVYSLLSSSSDCLDFESLLCPLKAALMIYIWQMPSVDN